MQNIPEVKLGMIAVSRDCFPIGLSISRREAIAKAYGEGLYECKVTVENEKDMLNAVADVKAAGCNALVVFLGNFGPETPETLIAREFDGPVMFIAAAEGDGDLINGRGDAYCGMLNCSYNLGMRHLKGYIPEYPVGTAADIGKMNKDFYRDHAFVALDKFTKGFYQWYKELSENARGFTPLNLVGPGKELTAWVKGNTLKGKDESYYLLEMIKASNKGNGEKHDNIFRYFLEFAYSAINVYTKNL